MKKGRAEGQGLGNVAFFWKQLKQGWVPSCTPSNLELKDSCDLLSPFRDCPVASPFSLGSSSCPMQRSPAARARVLVRQALGVLALVRSACMR